MNVFILPNMTRKNTLSVTQNAIAVLRELHCAVTLDPDLKEYFKETKGLTFLPADEAASKSDVIISVGGDGSLIYAAKYAANHKKPLLGINAGNLAFMAGLEGDETALLSRLISGEYTVDKRMLLRASILDAKQEEVYSAFCINDAVILRGNNMHLLRLSLYKDGEKLNDYNADGLIVATPTGSTAYSLSAGGPIIEPAVESIVVTPICSHSLMSRSVVLRDDAKVTVTVPFMGAGALLSCDSGEAVSLPEDGAVLIKKADITCDLIRIKQNSFIGILKDKFTDRTL